ncbi:hypothetical protein TREES_T100000927 [Tupaia chinensis]|uniref:Uncharacterized protein n=1 Tax=Tupaia chinensis TaxID=246437 RepID=L9JCW6_TUPCH|nr:hypothetical protein TREES_T100000927 [Tupaia chinensis]
MGLWKRAAGSLSTRQSLLGWAGLGREPGVERRVHLCLVKLPGGGQREQLQGTILRVESLTSHATAPVEGTMALKSLFWDQFSRDGILGKADLDTLKIPVCSEAQGFRPNLLLRQSARFSAHPGATGEPMRCGRTSLQNGPGLLLPREVLEGHNPWPPPFLRSFERILEDEDKRREIGVFESLTLVPPDPILPLSYITSPGISLPSAWRDPEMRDHCCVMHAHPTPSTGDR